MTQADQVLETMERHGGYARFVELNGLMGETVKTWGTKTPFATIRRIVQQDPRFFKIMPGLWGVAAKKDEVFAKLRAKGEGEPQFTHAYYQGLLLEVGEYKHLTTCVPAQDKNKLFVDKPLKDVATLPEVPEFVTYPQILKKAKTVDVSWFNARRMPTAFFEVEHTTDIEHSLAKFCDLQDFNVRLSIVAAAVRRKQFDSVLTSSAFTDIRGRVEFLSYEKLVKGHELLAKLSDMAV